MAHGTIAALPMPGFLRDVSAVLTLSFLLALSPRPFAQAPFEPKPGLPGKDVVWVPSQAEVVEKMLDMAGVTANDVVMDLGSGDGRNVIAAARRGARAIGVEYNPDLVELSRRLAREAGVAEKATFVQGDMYQADISQATVLALFLTPEVLDQMQEKFLAMKPGTRIVLNTFPITDWEPDALETVGAPCTAYCRALLMIVPANVAGTWQAGEMSLRLRQDYQMVKGTLGTQEVTGRLRGSEIALKSATTEYTGRATADRIEGTATTAGRQTRWTATRIR
jgi:precorrin-6B methylase 2